MKAIFISFILYEVSWGSLHIINRKIAQLTSYPINRIKIPYISYNLIYKNFLTLFD
jgi:hypothetical protein